MSRRICIPIATRGNFSKTKSLLRAIMAHPDLELQLVVSGGVALQRFGDYASVIRCEGFPVAEVMPFLLDGDSLETMGMSAALATLEFTRTLARLDPDIVFVIADRYEALSFAHAALCMNKTIAHLEGGEVSGSIDERIRHAITKLAHIHLPSNAASAERIIRMGEPPDAVFAVGTPSLDLLADIDMDDVTPLMEWQRKMSAADIIDFRSDYVLVSQHPVVTEYGSSLNQLAATAVVVKRLGLPTVWILPNMDAGEESGAKVVDELVRAGFPILCAAAAPMEVYARLMKHCRVMIGNSSSGIREAAYLGVPVVNVGSRQNNRQRGLNVVDVGYYEDEIECAARNQMDHGQFPSDPLYGDGHSGERIAEILASYGGPLDKAICY
jgi:UDP-hydrolysing UDP-N-acetyl-D-glucosamine 2-epimerase